MPNKKKGRGAKQQNAGVPVQQTIHAKNVQVGNNNVINDQSFNIGNDEATGNGAVQKRLYSEVLSGDTIIKGDRTGKSISQTINATHVTNVTNVIQASQKIQQPTAIEQKDDVCNIRKYTRRQKDLFLKSVNHFKRGYFALLIGKQSTLRKSDPLAYIKWTAVLDFDPEGESCGLFSRLHEMLSNLRSFYFDDIKDTLHNTISDVTTNWIFVRGTTGKPQLSHEPSEWRKDINTEMDSKLSLLNKFQAPVTMFTFVVVWPNDDIAVCMHFVLVKILSTFRSTRIVIIDGHSEKSSRSSNKLDDLRSEPSVTVFELQFVDFCNACMSVAEPVMNYERKYTLPAIDMGVCGISDDRYQWLNENLDVLYVENASDKHYTENMIKDELDQFYKGGTLSWDWWYAVKQGHAEIERDLFGEINDYIRHILVEKKESGLVTLLHDPGSGGTTLAQRVLWEFKKFTPCMQVKLCSEAHLTDLMERLITIGDKTKLPLVVMLDGESENRIKSLLMHAKGLDIVVVIFYVRRRNIQEESQGGNGTFILHGELSKNEAQILKMKINPYLRDKKRRSNVEKLIQDVINGKPRTIFEFGLAAHTFEYRGLKAYVEGHFLVQDNEKCKLLDWQVALAYLSFVYFYGHSSMPCKFFTSLLSKDERKPISEICDFPKEMHEFIVPDLNKRTKYFVRISHFYVAKEILERALLMMANHKTQEAEVSPFLCKKATSLLSKFSQQFISHVKQETKSELTGEITRVLVSTFIARGNKDLLEDDDTTPLRRRQQFSPLLEDASPSNPFTGRFEIYKTLADSFPLEPQFRAHLGRLFLKCRREDERSAENNLESAYDLIQPMIRLCRSESRQTLHQERFCIRNICHMYGQVVSQKIYKFTGLYYFSKPKISVSKEEFKARSEILLHEVEKACGLFEICREMTSPGHEQCVGYADEIRLRLMYCKFIIDHTDFHDIDEYLMNSFGEIPRFVESCYPALNVLFDELYDLIDVNKMQKDVQQLHDTYFELLRPKSSICMQNEDTPCKRRIDIGKLKHKYETKKKNSGYLLDLKDPEEITFIVKSCEKNFGTADCSDKGLDGDYREWIRAIRHPCFPEEYPLDKVYDTVKEWHDHVLRWNNIERQTVARFYKFVLASVIGFGTVDQPGNQELLRESQILKGEFRQHVKFSRNGDCRRELLGHPVDTVRRLVSSNTKDRTDKGFRTEDLKKLEIRTGKICYPNSKPSYGYINLDLGPVNKESIRVFYKPYKWDLKGTFYIGRRVEFIIEFNMVHGYEAYNVKLAEQADCSNVECGIKLTFRSSDTSVTCPRCCKVTMVDPAD